MKSVAVFPLSHTAHVSPVPCHSMKSCFFSLMPSSSSGDTRLSPSQQSFGPALYKIPDCPEIRILDLVAVILLLSIFLSCQFAMKWITAPKSTPPAVPSHISLTPFATPAGTIGCLPSMSP